MATGNRVRTTIEVDLGTNELMWGPVEKRLGKYPAKLTLTFWISAMLRQGITETNVYAFIADLESKRSKTAKGLALELITVLAKLNIDPTTDPRYLEEKSGSHTLVAPNTGRRKVKHNSLQPLGDNNIEEDVYKVHSGTPLEKEADRLLEAAGFGKAGESY